MANWSTVASGAIRDAVNQNWITNAEAAQLNRDIGNWADTIGRERKRHFDIRHVQVEATAEDHTVTNVIFGN